VERPRVTQAVSEAAAQGDRSENAEYTYGKKRLREIDRRVRFLRKRLDGMTVVDKPPTDEARTCRRNSALSDEPAVRALHKLRGFNYRYVPTEVSLEDVETCQSECILTSEDHGWGGAFTGQSRLLR